MKINYILILLFLLFTQVLFGQEHTQNAVDFLSTGDLISAEKEIQLALASEEENKNAYTWYISSYLLKEKYKANPAKESIDREEAIAASIKSLELDKEYQEQNFKIINYLASTCLKDAFLLTKSRDTSKIKSALVYYQKYEDSKKIIAPQEEFYIKKNDVYVYMANQFEKLYEKDKTQKSLIENAISYHKFVLETNPEDYRSNYNIAVDYYNQAVEQISRIDATTSFWDLIYIQETSIELFKVSLPYMSKAHQLDNTRLNTLKGLMQIYRALGDDIKYLEYKKKAEDFVINNDGKIKD